MTTFQRLALGLWASGMLAAVVLCRYTVVSAEGAAYRLDRWTGEVHWLAREESYLVKPADWGKDDERVKP